MGDFPGAPAARLHTYGMYLAALFSCSMRGLLIPLLLNCFTKVPKTILFSPENESHGEAHFLSKIASHREIYFLINIDLPSIRKGGIELPRLFNQILATGTIASRIIRYSCNPELF